VTNAMEVPGSEEDPDWDSLYRYRGNDATGPRPLFTGDVYFNVQVQGVGQIERKNVMVVQHPCALRVDGIHLADSLLAIEVISAPFYTAQQWQGNYKLMPLPKLVETSDEFAHQAALFTSSFLTTPDWLEVDRRVASLDRVGVNLLLQRWVFHNSRVVANTAKFDEVTSGPYEEATLIEEWCEVRAAKRVPAKDATEEANAWLDDKGDIDIRRRDHLENPQYRSRIRKKMRQAATALNK